MALEFWYFCIQLLMLRLQMYTTSLVYVVLRIGLGALCKPSVLVNVYANIFLGAMKKHHDHGHYGRGNYLVRVCLQFQRFSLLPLLWEYDRIDMVLESS